MCKATRQDDDYYSTFKASGWFNADLICFPELSYTGYFVRKERLELIAEKEEGLFVTRLCELAVRYGIGIAGGFAERDGENIYNSCVLVDRMGAVAGKARKVHLWKSEKKRFAAVDEKRGRLRNQ